ncbi:MAG: hypothetical protein AAF721_34265 [Myxococcota bacterium]
MRRLASLFALAILGFAPPALAGPPLPTHNPGPTFPKAKPMPRPTGATPITKPVHAKPGVKPPKPRKSPLVSVKPGVLHFVPPSKGASGCRQNDPDCNRCTANVVDQFRKVKRGQATWRSKPWRFEWGRRYVPYSIDGYQAFDEDSDLANGAGLSYSHPQGFVRTNSATVPYAGTHSRHDHRKPGTVFIVRQNSDGRKYLDALHRSHTTHPSGLHVLGKYLFYGERPKSGTNSGKNELRIIDLSFRKTRHDITKVMPAATGKSKGIKMFGGGVGLAKMSDGTYLLVSAVAGSRKPGVRYNQFFSLAGDLSRPETLSITYRNEHAYANPGHFAKDYRYSENLSLITECGTRDIYAVHTSGDGSGADGLIGAGYWRLSKLEVAGGKYRFRPLDVYEMSQNTADCHMRSAATVGVAPNGKLEFLCHQYRKDPDPSAVNWFEANTTGRDAWRFRAGVPQ